MTNTAQEAAVSSSSKNAYLELSWTPQITFHNIVPLHIFSPFYSLQKHENNYMKIYCNNVCNKNMHKFKKYEQEANQLVGQPKCCTIKIRPKAVRGCIFSSFF